MKKQQPEAAGDSGSLVFSLQGVPQLLRADSLVSRGD